MRVIFPTETHLMEFVSDISGRSKFRDILRELCATKVRGGFDEIDDDGEDVCRDGVVVFFIAKNT